MDDFPFDGLMRVMGGDGLFGFLDGFDAKLTVFFLYKLVANEVATPA